LSLALRPHRQRSSEIASMVEPVGLRFESPAAEDGLGSTVEFVIQERQRELRVDVDAAFANGVGGTREQGAQGLKTITMIDAGRQREPAARQQAGGCADVARTGLEPPLAERAVALVQVEDRM